jgi:hypothetical protein
VFGAGAIGGLGSAFALVIHVVPVENLKVAESGWRADIRAAYLDAWPLGP